MKKYLAELIGTFGLVLFGCGAAVIAGVNNDTGPSGIGLLGIAIAFGFSVVAMAYAIGGISGCHINPAISIAMLVSGKLNAKDTVGYIVAQCIGAVLATAVLYAILSGHSAYTGLGDWALGANGWGKGYLGSEVNYFNITSAFLTEAVMTFVFLFVIFATTSKFGNGTMAGLAIGVTLMLIHLLSIRVTGTSVNPARSLGPAIFAGGVAIQQLWLFIVAPITGAVLSALVWKFGFEEAEA
ncbi:MAG: MIP family channel protein [Chitinophagales bacterium]|nr:MIP family channel protein [Chitinophagales bacterium]